MPSDQTRLALYDIRDNGKLAQQFVAELSLETFRENRLYFYAVTRALEIISEAARRLPTQLRDRHPQLPWRAILGVGNVSLPGHMPDVPIRFGRSNTDAGKASIDNPSVGWGICVMFGDGSAAGRACPSGSGASARRLLGAFAFTALMAPDAIFAQSNPVSVPEVRIIANTPLAPASSRPAATTSAPAATTPARRVVAEPASRAAPPVSRDAALAPVDPGLIDRDKVPANVQTFSAGDFEHAKAPDLLDAISRSLPGIALIDQTGNEFQRDLNYRGFVASPVVGTPQGLAVYQNGVRVNEVFGDTVNWDFIPETAINRMTMMPSNPVYGLNALGGALSIDMKNGFTYQGTDSELRGGSFGRRAASVQTGGQAGNLSAYLTADAINDNGWRDYSPSQLRRIYGDLGARGDQTEFHVTFTGASNKFGAAAATPLQLLNQNWASVYTVPQTTQNQLAFLTASANWNPVSTLSFQANAYYRGFWQHHVDGNGTAAQNSDCPDPDFLCFPDLNGNLVNLTGLNGLPVPAAGVLANSILGEIDRTSTAANSFGGSLQAATTAKVLGHDNRFVIGASIDNGRVQFDTTSELGTINADQWPVVQGVGFYINQPSGDVAPVGVLSKTLYTGVYATDTFDLTSRLSVTFGGRFNVAQIGLTDTLGNNEGLNGDHMYSQFNPVIGATFKITPNVTVYGGYAQANRAPTPLELGCSDPMRPCLLDNALVGDPPLKQVVSHTYEAGLRGHIGSDAKRGVLNWNLGVIPREKRRRHHQRGEPASRASIFSERRRHVAPRDRSRPVLSMGSLEFVRQLHLCRGHLP